MHNLERKTDPLGNQNSGPLIGEKSAFGLGRAFARGGVLYRVQRECAGGNFFLPMS